MRPAIPAAALAASLFLSGCAADSCCRKSVSPNAPASAAKWPWKIPAPAAFLAQMPPPPAPDSATARRDLETVLALQAKATPAKIAQAKASYDLTVFTFAPALDPEFTAEHYPETARFFQELNDLVNHVNNAVKDAYKRPHPFQVSAQVQRFVIAKPGYSYPSYHSARCVVFGNVLAELDPTRTAAFDRISAQVEEDRVFAGEHFPSDIEAGRRLGRLIWDALEKDASFRAGVLRLKQAEWTPPPAVR